MMAAVSLSRSRVAGVRTTRGLFSIFTLLALVCLASALTDEEELEKLKKYVQEMQQILDNGKAMYNPKMSTAKDLISLSVRLMETAEEFFPDGFEEGGFLQRAKQVVKKIYKDIHEEDVKIRAQMDDNEQKLEKYKKYVKFLEESQAEL